MCPKAIRNDIPKPCSKCGIVQPPENYYQNRNRPGLMASCKTCWKKKTSKWAKDNPLERRRINAEAKGRVPPQKRRDIARKAFLKAKYGITPEEEQEMFDRQNGQCAICGSTDPRGNTGRFHIDHDHSTGRVRGLLCNNCNTGLGLLGDNIEGLRNALQYLERG